MRRLWSRFAGVAVLASAITVALVAVAADRAGDPDVEVAGTFVTVAPSTTVASTTTTAPPPPRQFTLAVSGDIIPHDPVSDQARRNGAGDTYDYRPMFDRVRSRLTAADLAICHLETPLWADGSRVQGFPTFSAPPALAEAIVDAGYDGCSTASNHSYDQGRQGVLDTVALFDSLGLGISGMADGVFRDFTPTLYEVDGGAGGSVTVAHVSFTYGLNGLSLPEDLPWLVDVIDPLAIIEEAAEARRSGAEMVVVSLHWGVEYVVDPTDAQRELAAQLLASPDIDVLVGHHAHVVQTIELVGDNVVVFGLGNFLSNQSANCCPAATQDGVIVELDLTEDAGGRFAVTSVRFVPTWVDHSTYTVVPVGEALADPATPADLRATLQASWDRTVEVIGRGGVAGADAAG